MDKHDIMFYGRIFSEENVFLELAEGLLPDSVELMCEWKAEGESEPVWRGVGDGRVFLVSIGLMTSAAAPWDLLSRTLEHAGNGIAIGSACAHDESGDETRRDGNRTRGKMLFPLLVVNSDIEEDDGRVGLDARRSCFELDMVRFGINGRYMAPDADKLLYWIHRVESCRTDIAERTADRMGVTDALEELSGVLGKAEAVLKRMNRPDIGSAFTDWIFGIFDGVLPSLRHAGGRKSIPGFLDALESEISYRKAGEEIDVEAVWREELDGMDVGNDARLIENLRESFVAGLRKGIEIGKKVD